MYVSKIMTQPVFSCSLEDSLERVAGKMWNHDLGCLPVVDREGKVVGMITDRDICMAAYTQGVALSNISVSSAMSQSVYFCTPDESIQEAEEKMASHRVRRLPVLNEDRKLIGLLALSDLAQEAEREIGIERKEISRQEVTDTFATISQPRGFQMIPHV